MNEVRRFKKRALVALGCIAALFAVAIPAASGQTSGTPSIQFLSPSSVEGEVPTLTDEATAVNAAYRLSAWTANAPSGAIVEFELVPGDSFTQPMTIGVGRAVLPDTFEYDWDIAEGPTGVLEGAHTLKATLYDAAGDELAATTQAVNILHGSSGQTNGEASIDFTYPVSGGPLGYYTASNGVTNSMFDGVKLDQAASVKAYYTTTQPGSLPEWRVCNTGELTLFFDDGVRCNYPKDKQDTDVDEGVDVSQVTAVALTLAREDGSADIARVVPYLQVPSSLTQSILGRSDSSGGPSTSKTGVLRKEKDERTGFFPCSDWIRVAPTDQVGRKIAAVNLDAHAQGPSDQLKFNNSYLSSVIGNPPLLPPSDGHSAPEKAANCRSDNDTIGQQGEHGIAGQPDRKHVETRTGTNDAGQFDFALATDQPGIAQVTIWVDQKDDDRFCRGEEGASTSIGFAWGVAEQPAQSESPADCVSAQPSPDPTIVEPPVFDGSRTARIQPAKVQVVSGRRVGILGGITAVEEACEVGQALRLRAKRPSAARFRTIAGGTTDATGTHTFRVLVERTKVYKVVAPAAGECVRARSTTATIRAV